MSICMYGIVLFVVLGMYTQMLMVHRTFSVMKGGAGCLSLYGLQNRTIAIGIIYIYKLHHIQLQP